MVGVAAVALQGVGQATAAPQDTGPSWHFEGAARHGQHATKDGSAPDCDVQFEGKGWKEHNITEAEKQKRFKGNDGKRFYELE